jgi:hypothetical protein
VVAHPEAVRWVLTALRSLGEKAPNRHVAVLASASELETLNQETVKYIYDALQQLRDRLLKAERRWPLVEATRAYSNLLGKHSAHIWDRWKKAVEDMCELYSKVRRRNAAAAPGGGLSAHRLFNTAARASVLAVALKSDVLASLVQDLCVLGDLVKEAEAVRSTLDEAAAHPEELKNIESDADFVEWVTARDVTGDAGGVVEDLRAWLTYVLARYKLNHALNEIKGELDEKKLEKAAEEFEKAAEMRRKLKQLEGYLTARGLALKARVLAAKSWEELLERAKGFRELWREAEEHLEPTAKHLGLTAEYLATAAFILGEYLVYLAASGNEKGVEELLKERWWLLNYVPEVSVVTRLMLRVLGVGEWAGHKEGVVVFRSRLPPELILLMLVSCLRRDKAPEERDQLSKAEYRVDSAASATGVQAVIGKSRSCIVKVRKTRPLLDKVDGRTQEMVLAPGDPQAQLVFILLTAVNGRMADAVRLYARWGSMKFKEPLPRRLFRAVYENCGDLNSEGCRMALLKLYYYNF